MPRSPAASLSPGPLTPIANGGNLHSMITDGEKQAIITSWRMVAPIATSAAELFYERLFELKPEYRALFPADMEQQKEKLMKMLTFIVDALDYQDSSWSETVAPERDLFLVVVDLGRRHSELYHVADDAYHPVGEALIWALDRGLGEAFTEEVRSAWLHVYRLLAMTMRMGKAAS